jgi:hypothetical protein
VVSPKIFTEKESNFETAIWKDKNFNVIIKKIMRKKIIIAAIVIAAIAAGIFGWKKYKNYRDQKEQTMSVFEALVMVVDQKASNPEEDARSSMKKGDVIAVFPEGHPWSDTEKTSYLIVKIKTTQENANKLTEPVTKEVKNPQTPQNPEGQNGEGASPQTETVRARKYRLDISIPTVNELMTKGGPYKDKVFGEGVIEEK